MPMSLEVALTLIRADMPMPVTYKDLLQGIAAGRVLADEVERLRKELKNTKAKSTIRKEIRLLETMAESEEHDDGGIAYKVYHALRWVIEDVSWTPHGVVGRCQKLKAVEAGKKE